MTVEAILTEVFEAMGRPKSIDPFTAGVFDIATAGAQRMLRWLNIGYRRIVTWKMPQGDPIRYKCLEGELYIKLGGPLSGVAMSIPVVATGNDRVVISGITGYYTTEAGPAGIVVKIASGTGIGQIRSVVSLDLINQELILNEEWDTNPDGTSTAYLYSAYFPIITGPANYFSMNLPDGKDYRSLVSINRVYDTTNSMDLLPRGRAEIMEPGLLIPGDASQFSWDGTGLRFNVPLESETAFRIEYTRDIDDLVSAAQEPDLPLHVHWGLVLWMRWWGLAQNQETSMAWAAKQDLNEFMATIKPPGYDAPLRSEARMIVEE